MEFSAKSTEKYFLSIFAEKSQHKPKVNWVLSPLRLLMWRTKLNWIQTGALEGFLIEAYEIKTTYYINLHNYCFSLKIIYIGIRYRHTVLHCPFQQGRNLSFIIDTLIYEALYIYKLVQLFVENIWKQIKIHISSVGKVVLRFECPT